MHAAISIATGLFLSPLPPLCAAGLSNLIAPATAGFDNYLTNRQADDCTS
jgi:hypothetical protein